MPVLVKVTLECDRCRTREETLLPSGPDGVRLGTRQDPPGWRQHYGTVGCSDECWAALGNAHIKSSASTT